jgi:hypothetical protein
LPFSRTEGKDSMSKTRRVYKCGKRKQDAKGSRAITAQEALTLLESAVSYCQLAGLKVQAANGENDTLTLFIPNAHYTVTDNGTKAAFRIGASLAEAERTNGTSIGTGEVMAHG